MGLNVKLLEKGNLGDLEVGSIVITDMKANPYKLINRTSSKLKTRSAKYPAKRMKRQAINSKYL